MLPGCSGWLKPALSCRKRSPCGSAASARGKSKQLRNSLKRTTSHDRSPKSTGRTSRAKSKSRSSAPCLPPPRRSTRRHAHCLPGPPRSRWPRNDALIRLRRPLWACPAQAWRQWRMGLRSGKQGPTADRNRMCADWSSCRKAGSPIAVDTRLCSALVMPMRLDTLDSCCGVMARKREARSSPRAGEAAEAEAELEAAVANGVEGTERQAWWLQLWSSSRLT